MRQSSIMTGRAAFLLSCFLLACAGGWLPGCTEPENSPRTEPRPGAAPAVGAEGPEAPSVVLPPTAVDQPDPKVFQEIARPAGTPSQSVELLPGDLIQVSVYNHPDLSVTLRLSRDGTCTFPLLGRIRLGGVTLGGVEDLLKSRLEKEVLTYAHVTVYVKEYTPRKAYILGAVVQPGAYSVPPAEGLTLLQLLALARGFSRDADQNRVRLIRTARGERKAYVIPVLSMMNGDQGEIDVPLLPGDRVFVGTLRRICVLGAVKSPQGIEVNAEEPLHLTRALSMAGGFAQDADRSAILLVRHHPKGDRVYLLDYVRVESGRDPKADAVLSPGDTVIVRTQGKVFVLGSVARPGGFVIPAEGLTATKAVSLAGGFTKRANLDGTIVVRVVGGRKVVLPVSVGDVVSEEAGQGVALLPGDIVYVPERFF